MRPKRGALHGRNPTTVCGARSGGGVGLIRVFSQAIQRRSWGVPVPSYRVCAQLWSMYLGINMEVATRMALLEAVEGPHATSSHVAGGLATQWVLLDLCGHPKICTSTHKVQYQEMEVQVRTPPSAAAGPLKQPPEHTCLHINCLRHADSAGVAGCRSWDL